MRAWGLQLAVLVSVFSPALSYAFECKVSDKRPELSLYWGQRDLEFGVQASSNLDPGHVQAAFAVWVTPNCSDLTFTYVGLVADSDPVSKVGVVFADWAARGRPPEAVAITETTFRPSTGAIERAVIEVNEDIYSFGDVEDNCPPAVYDRVAVLTHEVGHFLGLGHTQEGLGTAADPTMSPQVATCESDKRTLEDDDVAGLCFLYPAGGFTGRCGGLADQGSYVSNVPFGCSSGAPSALNALWLLVVGLGWARLRTR